MPVLIVFVLGFLLGVIQTRRRGGRWLDCAHRGVVYALALAIVAFVVLTISDKLGLTLSPV